MGGYDLVLGVDWLGALGQSHLSTTRNTDTISGSGKQVVLKGNSKRGKPLLQQMSVDAFIRSCQREEHGFLYLLYANKSDEEPPQTGMTDPQINPDLQAKL